CDFECSNNCGLLYLALKYHKLHCGYVETRFADLRGYPVKVLLAYVNVEDPSFLLRDLNMFCYRMDVSLVLCYSVEEAAEYIETFKFTEHRNVEKELSKIQQYKLQRQQQQMNKT
uniref:Structure-specific endonuclease subunit SLX1 n=1 Tax=Globodera pallida TaxID=36090 RepID=A0A183CBH1_GLOPA